ncbi:hypothetical protein POX_f07479 [Penicillium oxalicum]|uniref:Uncharacterized protein n=1 Tax=Penicillium oxalicum (strain 114-2 / CGMCC 5302) TaxID=933388 RepID=S7ZI87_PENO1|nr:hypothetical protein POX_f07479 [Penicillium oxalicum]EPS28396.1 hypothetical protein PDE_03342 [Penicillium oxalicum 114-2]KAI2787119.1 hypothetical protein POX_f07479 [Penicillium oxalicum]
MAIKEGGDGEDGKEVVEDRVDIMKNGEAAEEKASGSY